MATSRHVQILVIRMDIDTKNNITQMEGTGCCVPSALLPLLRGLSGCASFLPLALAPGSLWSLLPLVGLWRRPLLTPSSSLSVSSSSPSLPSLSNALAVEVPRAPCLLLALLGPFAGGRRLDLEASLLSPLVPLPLRARPGAGAVVMGALLCDLALLLLLLLLGFDDAPRLLLRVTMGKRCSWSCVAPPKIRWKSSGKRPAEPVVQDNENELEQKEDATNAGRDGTTKKRGT